MKKLFIGLVCIGSMQAMKERSWMQDKIDACKNGNRNDCALVQSYIKRHAKLICKRQAWHDGVCNTLWFAMQDQKFVEQSLNNQEVPKS